MLFETQHCCLLSSYVSGVSCRISGPAPECNRSTPPHTCAWHLAGCDAAPCCRFCLRYMNVFYNADAAAAAAAAGGVLPAWLMSWRSPTSCAGCCCQARCAQPGAGAVSGGCSVRAVDAVCVQSMQCASSGCSVCWFALGSLAVCERCNSMKAAVQGQQQLQ